MWLHLLDMQWDPNKWPKTFSQGLYGIFGRLIASAQSENTRLKYALRMLAWWRDRINPASANYSALIRSITPARMANQDWTPGQIIEEKRGGVFSEEDYNSWNYVRQQWMGKRFKKRRMYKPKNQLDPFLRFIYKGKYKHTRYAKYTDFIVRGKGSTPGQAAEIIARQKREGVPAHIRDLLSDEIRRFEAICRKQHGLKANEAKQTKQRRRQEEKLPYESEKSKICENCQWANKSCSCAFPIMPPSILNLHSSMRIMPVSIYNILYISRL